MIIKDINEICASKLGWAYRGKEKFIDSLNLKEFKELYKTTNNGKTNVAVFGNSQVGKTTLILNLLGIRADSDLHQILRGKKTQGKSVTATTMVYLRSDKEDDKFYYQEFEAKELSLTGKELEEKIIALRDSIERGNYSLPDMSRISFVTIKIPAHYFLKSETNLNINIIDLPGVNSANEKEHEYINELIKKVVPLLDIILLVEAANNFASRLDNLGVPEIERYRDIPERFRLILTYTFSNGSEEGWIKNKDLISQDLIRQRMHGELSNSIKNFPSEMRIFPIEFGDSWSKLEKENRQLFNKVSEINAEFLHDLIKDINASITEHNRLMQMIKLTKTISKRIEKEKEQFEFKIQVFEEQKTSIQKFIEQLNTGIGNNNKIIETIQKQKEKFDIENFEIDKYGWQDSKKPSVLASILSERKKNIKSKANEYFKTNYKVIPDPFREQTVNEIDDSLKLIFNDLINDLNDKNEIFNWFLRDYKGYHDKARDISNQAVNDVKKIVDQLRIQRIKYNKDLLSFKIKAKEDENALFNADINSKKEELLTLNNKISNTRSLKYDFEKNSQEDLRTSQRFIDFIKLEYFQNKNNLINTINSECANEKKFLSFLSLFLIAQELEKLEGQII